ncbi:hypothetical protein DINM_001328 [Dirofilaria immitis]|nr:hypothetical protein [Dirofilaria immitis]
MVRHKTNQRKHQNYRHGVLGEDSSLSAVICLEKKSKQRQFSVLPKPPEFTGTLEPNQELTNAEILLMDEIIGPESIAIHEKIKLYMLHLKMAKLVKGFKLTQQYDQLCDGSYHSLPKCGRPLGIRFSRQNPDLLIIADAYHGFFEANFQHGTIRQFLKPGTKITYGSSSPVIHFNDFDISQNGRHIIFTEPSHRFMDRDCFYAMAEHRPDGRLLDYNMHTGELRVLVDNLYYPNGVEFDRTGKCVFLPKWAIYCFTYKFEKYTVVASNLPGYPDNIRTSNNGMLWVPLGHVRLKDDSWITERPFLRNIVAMATELDDGTILLGGDNNMFLARFKPSKML